MWLITTADQRFWKTDEHILFLGEWCRLYSCKKMWESLKADVVPYHWDDRRVLHQDYLYLKRIVEELLRELADKLNEINGIDHSLRYWRIIIGPWLYYFVHILYDRWEMIRRAVSNYPITGVFIRDTIPEQIVPNDMVNFYRLYEGDFWNEAIYGQLLQDWTSVHIEKVRVDIEENLSLDLRPALTLARWLKSKLVCAASFITQMLTREDEAFFISSYLPTWYDFYLQWHLGQIPKLWRTIEAPRVEVDWSKRQWRLDREEERGFSAIVRSMISRHIPTIYLEGYDALKTFCDDLPWPNKPSLIFTSNAYFSDDVFKAWAAKKAETGSPLVIGQHGGMYGVALEDSGEDHEIAVSDHWLSWGWDDLKKPQIKPVCNFKKIGCDMGWDPKGRALMVEMAMSRYSYQIYSVPMSSQWLGYFHEQCRFVEALPDAIRKNLLIRLYMHDYGWCQAERWKDRFPDISLDDGLKSMAQLMKKSRIYISTYNATTFLESLTMNMPTIIFWNPLHWELRPTAQPYFDYLEQVGIFHGTPESAAAKMSEIWENVDEWWKQSEIQGARHDFCERFSWMPENPFSVLKETMVSVKTGGGKNR